MQKPKRQSLLSQSLLLRQRVPAGHRPQSLLHSTPRSESPQISTGSQVPLPHSDSQKPPTQLPAMQLSSRPQLAPAGMLAGSRQTPSQWRLRQSASLLQVLPIGAVPRTAQVSLSQKRLSQSSWTLHIDPFVQAPQST